MVNSGQKPVQRGSVHSLWIPTWDGLFGIFSVFKNLNWIIIEIATFCNTILAIKWVKNTEGPKGLKIIDLQQHDFLRTLENAIQFGTPVLLQNIQEQLDPSLTPVLNKAYTKQGGRLVLRLGDKVSLYLFGPFLKSFLL